MKYTLLQMTQMILSSMDSDEVNSITATVEAGQVANVIKTVYFDILSRANLPETYDLFGLQAPPSTYGPVFLMLPPAYDSVEWVRYNKETTDDTDDAYGIIEYVSKEEFISRMMMLKESDDNVGQTTRNGVKYFYTTDAGPTYYTSFDDRALMFNSYDSEVDTSLRPSKSLAYGKKSIPWSMADGFTPDLDDDQFPLLLNEAKALAWMELKQQSHQKAEINSKRGWTRLQRTKDSVPTVTALDRLPNYGRKKC